MALTQVKTTGIADDAVTTDKLADAINTARDANTAKATNATHTGDVTGSGALTIAAGAVDIAMLANGTDGQVITWDANGAATAVGPGTDGQVLTSTGAGSPPAFETPAAGVGGATGADFNDDVKLRFGTGNDLEIYHDGSTSWVADVGTGPLGLATNNTCTIWNSADSEVIAKFIGGGTNELYHDGSKKLETTAAGVSVTGNVVMSAGGGIDFSAETNTAVSGTSADSDENLNHYEYGTWTAAFASGGSNTNANCDYIRIGKFVMISGNISVDNITNNAALSITGIPFSVITNKDFTGSLRGYGIGNPTINTNSYAINSTIDSSDSIGFGAAAPQGMGWEMIHHNDFSITNNSVRWTLTYITDS